MHEIESTRSQRLKLAKLAVDNPDLTEAEVADLFNERWNPPVAATPADVRRAQSSAVAQFQAGLAQIGDAHVMRELSRLAWVEAQAKDGWERSTKPKEVRRKTERASETGVMEEIMEEQATQPGDPRFLRIFIECSERRGKLLGLEANGRGGNAGPQLDGATVLNAAFRVFVKNIAPTGFKTRTIDAAEAIKIGERFLSELAEALNINGPVEPIAPENAQNRGFLGDEGS